MGKKEFRSRGGQIFQIYRKNTGHASAGFRDATSIEQAARAMLSIQKRAVRDAEEERARNVKITLASLPPLKEPCDG